MGDDDVLATLARERGRALFGYAYLLTGQVHAAEDLVQEALVRTFARRRAGFTPDSAEAYVRRAILSTFLDDARRRRRWSGIRHLLGRHDEAVRDPAPGVGDGLDVRAALATLAPQERAAAVLRWCEDLTVPEVAARMGLAVGTVKRYLSTAGHKLEALLGPLPDDESVPLTSGRTRS